MTTFAPPVSAPLATPARRPPVYRENGWLGSLRAFQADPASFFRRLADAKGDVVETNLGPTRVTVLRHPEHAERVLVENVKNYGKDTRGYAVLRKVLGRGLLTSEGDFWRRQRRIAQPAFHRQRIAAFAETMVTATSRMLDERWGEAATSGTPIDVADEMMRLTLGIVSETMLGIGVGDRADVVGRALPTVLEHVIHRITHPLSLPEIFPTQRNRSFRNAVAQLDAVVGGIIDERRRGGTAGRDDLLSMLMEARDAESGESMSDRELRDEVMTMYLAGHETTAAALSWTFLLLSQHPAWEARVVEEVRAVLGDARPGLASLRELDVLKRVIAEAMRLYPPVWLLARTAQQDDVVGGFRIPAGRLVFLSPWLVHRHPDFWPDPDRFDPDRFLPEAVKARPRLAYLPFSAGTRKCIGDQFATMEAELILAAVLQRYRVVVPGGNVAAQYAVTMRPRGGMPVRLVPRSRDGSAGSPTGHET